ncbi:MAG: WhiB family transcriptional regulator [Acidimicrobiia bacterium]
MAVRTLDTWRDRAACRGPETSLFFPPTTAERRDDRDARERRAKAICFQCAVREECLTYAMGIGELHGIWGGLNESERRARQAAALR